MKTDPNPKLPAAELQDAIDRAVAGGLEPASTRELLGALLDSLFRAERKQYLEQSSQDKGNGSYDRSLGVGSLPVEVQVPRSRSGQFRPSHLPDPYQRALGDAAADLLMRVAASSRSLNATKEALRGLGLNASDAALDSVAQHFAAELNLRNTRPLDTDLLALFIDAKYIELRQDDRLRPACLYVIVGLGRDGKKRVLACVPIQGRESLDNWKTVLRSLLERGLRNVLIVVQDDFSGLLTVTKSLFPQADVQLCIVHMQRNAKSHLGKDQAAQFNNRMRTIKTAWTPELAATQFDDLCRDFAEVAPTFIAEISKKRPHYLAFLAYPESLRRTFSTTNAVEAVNGQLEILRRNNGGYFHGEEILKAKLGITIERLENGSWRRVAAAVQAALHQLNAMFVARFESP